MLIQHIGHAEFLLTLESGMRIVTDPYDDTCGYPLRPVEADAVLISHHHHDHDAVENVSGHPQIIDYAGEHTLAPGIRLTALLGDHDDAGGALRGKTLLFLLEAEGLRVAHLGDLGAPLSEEQQQLLGSVDVLMVPVGGFYTLDADAARRAAEVLQARVVLPMHYRTEFNPDWPISPVSAFTALYPPDQVRSGGQALRITAGDLSCHPRVVVL